MTCFPPRRLDVEVANGLVTSVLPVTRPHQILPETQKMSHVVNLRSHFYGRYHMYFTKNFEVLMSYALLCT